MKFVCENCKAKYQIGDEKVSGRTLRMKCRRCGEMIQVSATVTETSVSTKLPGEHAAGSAPSPVRATPPPRPAALDEPTGDDGATVIRPSPFFTPKASEPPDRAPKPPPPRPAFKSSPGMPPAAPRPGQARGPASTRPPAAQASVAGAALAAASGGAAAPMHSPSSPGLYSGFARAVAAPPQPAASLPLPTEDWYVGIGGVPLGPVRLAVLRDKAAASQVDGDSLVWREGFDEWQPVRSIPPLLSMVEEARQVRGSRTSMPAVVAPQPRASMPLAASSSAPAAAVSYAGGSPTFGAKPASASVALPDAAPSLPFDLVRSSSAPPVSVIGPGGPVSSPGTLGGPFNGSTNGGLSHAAPGVAAGPAPSPGVAFSNGSPAAYGLTTTAGVASSPSALPAPMSERSPSSIVRKKRGVPPAAYALIAMAAAFGGVAAWAVFLRKDPGVVYVQQTAAAAGEQPLSAPPPPPPTGAATEVVAQTDPGAATTSTPGVGPRGPFVPGPGKTNDPAAPIDTTGFNKGGPAGPSGDTPPSGGGALTEGEINGVVSRNKPMITRRCWTPAYDARSPSAPPNAKVSVSLKVGPSGSVSSASAGGSEAHYPGLASCVAGSVKNWTFPPSDEGATVNIPFSFSGQ